MVRMKFSHHAVVAALLIGFGAPISAEADKIDDYVSAQMRQLHIPGLSIAIVRDGQITKAQGYGFANVELKAHATTTTVYEIGSNTKQFTAAAIMMLVEEGKVHLEDAITKYFPEAPEAWHGITVRHLLSHTSGIQNHVAIPHCSTFSEPISPLRQPRRAMSCSRCFSGCLWSFGQAKPGPTIIPVIICSE